jgi:hypothetical protein
MGMPHGFYESGFGEVFEGENDYLGEEVRRMIMDGTISKKSQDVGGKYKDIMQKCDLRDFCRNKKRDLCYNSDK